MHISGQPVTADTAQHQTPKLTSLTSLRFFAAALVLVHHAAYFFTPGTVLEKVTQGGYVGVGFFFTLSGFVLMWSYNPDLSRRHFYGRRVARVYPMHLATAALALVLLVAWGRASGVLEAVLNVALMQSWVPLERFGSSLNGVSWSLCCEAFFYAVFPFIAARAARWRPRNAALVTVALLAVVGLAVVAMVPEAVAQQILYKGPAYRVGEFVLGILIAVALRSGFRLRVAPWVVLAAVAVSYAVAVEAPAVAVRVGLPGLRVFGDWAMIPASCLLIAAVATFDLERRETWLHHPGLVRLGEASFALYLLHYLLFQAWVEALGVPSTVAAGVGVAAVLCLAAVGLSLAAYRWLERPAEAQLRLRLGTPADR